MSELIYLDDEDLGNITITLDTDDIFDNLLSTWGLECLSSFFKGT